MSSTINVSPFNNKVVCRQLLYICFIMLSLWYKRTIWYKPCTRLVRIEARFPPKALHCVLAPSHVLLSLWTTLKHLKWKVKSCGWYLKSTINNILFELGLCFVKLWGVQTVLSKHTSDLWVQFFPVLRTTSSWRNCWCYSLWNALRWVTAFTNCIVLKPTVVIMPESCLPSHKIIIALC